MERSYLKLDGHELVSLRMRPEAVGHGVLGASTVTVGEVRNRQFDTHMLAAPQLEAPAAVADAAQQPEIVELTDVLI